MPAPLQGAYRKLEFQYIIISSLKGKVLRALRADGRVATRYLIATRSAPFPPAKNTGIRRTTSTADVGVFMF